MRSRREWRSRLKPFHFQLLQVRSPIQISDGLDWLAIDFTLRVTERMVLEREGAIES